MSKVQFHTIDQPISDTTTFILSCNRLDVLDITIQSFLRTRDYITKMVLVDDSAELGLFETLVERYGTICDIICFPRNRSQWWAMDFMVSYCDSEYIFYLEDDWEMLRPDYLNKSKEILQKYRNIGTVDVSWRTFEGQKIDSYHKELIDDTFYHKKTWRITDYHLSWYGWIGSPNLKRRDDLILLGRIEKWHNEWNIDRKFLALGFKAVFLNGEYARHLGDNCSRMASRRPIETTTPEDYYPKELLSDRLMPKLDYGFLDTHVRHPHDITIVSAMVDLGRGDRHFEDHYMESLVKLLASRHAIVLYTHPKYFDKIREIRGDHPLKLIEFTLHDIAKEENFSEIQQIIFDPAWFEQSDWMLLSTIRSPFYIPLTLLKQKLLNQAKDYFNSSYFYWVDAGIFNSYHIRENIDEFYFTKVPKDRFFITSFPYHSDVEIHGYNVNDIIDNYGNNPTSVCRATFFGGTKAQISQLTVLFYAQVAESLQRNCIGAEEAIYTILNMRYPELFDVYAMHNGDIYTYFKEIK